MQLACLRSYATLGIEAPEVQIEVHLASGLPAFTIVGLPETEVRESRDRVRSAILNSGFEFPARRITVNLAPADLPKHGGRFDLPIALGVLIASGQVEAERMDDSAFIGELSLAGDLRPVRNALAVAGRCREIGQTLYCPAGNERELQPFYTHHVRLADHLLDVTAHLQGDSELGQPQAAETPVVMPSGPELADVRGQHQARRALEIAAAGRHNILLCGPPGSGKTMLAARLPGILPPLSDREHLDCAIIHASQGLSYTDCQPPFRAPHHTSSPAALVGGGNLPKPGDISLAHGGVLFLDEFAEFSPKALQALREPLECGEITLSRANYKCSIPARFQLVAAMNPCPCGHWGTNRCRCTESAVRRYAGRVSGPLLDRIDLHLSIQQPKRQNLLEGDPGESSALVRKRVVEARNRSLQRQGCVNAELAGEHLEQHLQADFPWAVVMEEAAQRLQLSARVIHRMLRVARTIADLDQQDSVQRHHLTEALGFRQSTIIGDA